MEAVEKIRHARNNLVCDYGFFAQLLLSCTIKEIKDKALCPTLCTDGNNIYYSEAFVNEHTSPEVAFVVMHEVMHCALGHLWRRGTRDKVVWNMATDYAINIMIKNIADAYYNKNSSPLKFQLEIPEGLLLEESFEGKSAEEIYNILMENSDSDKGNGQISIFKNNKSSNHNSSHNSSQNSSHNSSQNSNDNSQSDGKWWLRKNKDGSYSGNLYSPRNHGMWDNADKLSDNDKSKKIKEWEERMITASEQMKQAGVGEKYLERVVNNIKHPQKNWRILLHDFIQEEVNDYSWAPPDKRYDGDFFLCDYNDTIDTVKDILFFVDTSGSMGSKQLNLCFSEIQGAINQFKNHLKGTMLFFDDKVKSKTYDFDDVEGDVSKLTAFGGGGTSYKCIFDYLEYQDKFTEINGIIILTDGYCTYPSEEPPYPILWVYTNTEFHDPPYGLHTELESEYDLSDYDF